MVASLAGLAPMRGTGAYVASKHALLGRATRSVRTQLSVACPGPLRTDMSRTTPHDRAATATLAGLAPAGFPTPSVLTPAQAVDIVM